MHVTEVMINNLKATTGATYTLGPKTLIVGRNGSGKTTILNAISLALIGSAFDVAGRTGEGRVGEIASHLVRRGAVSASALVTLSDGSTHGWTSGEQTAPAFRADDVFPLAALTATMGGTNAERAAWLASRGDALLRTVIDETAPSALAPLFAGVKTVADLETMQDGLAATLRQARATAKAALARADALTAQATYTGASADALREEAARIEAQIASASSAVTPTVFRRWQDDLAQLRTDLAKVSQERAHEEADDSIAVFRANIEKEAADLADLRARLDAARAVLDANPAPVVDEAQVARRRAGLAVMERVVVQLGQGAACPCCGGTNGSTVFAAQQVAALRAAVDAVPVDAHADLRVKYAQRMTEYAKRDVMLTEARTTLAMRERSRRDSLALFDDRIRQRAAQIVDLAAKIDAAVVSDGVDVDALRARLTQVQAAIDAATRADGVRATISTARKEAAEATAEAAKTDTVIDVCKQVRVQLARRVVSDTEQSVTRWLPGGETFKLVEDGVHRRFALVHADGTTVTAPSGAEETRLLMALSAADVAAKGRVSHPVICVAAERQWAPGTLTATMRALTDAAPQVIIVSTVRPAGKTPRGWTVIDLGDEPSKPRGTKDDDGEQRSTDTAAVKPAAPDLTPGVLADALNAVVEPSEPAPEAEPVRLSLDAVRAAWASRTEYADLPHAVMVVLDDAFGEDPPGDDEPEDLRYGTLHDTHTTDRCPHCCCDEAQAAEVAEALDHSTCVSARWTCSACASGVTAVRMAQGRNDAHDGTPTFRPLDDDCTLSEHRTQLTTVHLADGASIWSRKPVGVTDAHPWRRQPCMDLSARVAA